MGSSEHYDVIVVGAGPAGGVAAYLLADAGCRVLLLEKEKLPRYKACGGALVPRGLEALPFPIQEAHITERLVSRFRLTNDLRKPFLIERDSPVIAMTMRSAFDEYIALKAVQVGAVLKDQVTVNSIIESSDSVRCETSAGAFVGTFLIGADGANSVVARKSPQFVPPRCGVALEVEVYLRTDKLLSEYANQVDFDFNVLPRGYGWIFPKADHLSAGVFTLKPRLSAIKDYYEAYCRRKGLTQQIAHEVVKGHLIPIGPKTGKLNSKRILLVGDAAGLVDPLTGEGISYAVRSGLLAAKSIVDTLRSTDKSLDSYSQEVSALLITEIKLGSLFARFLYGVPSVFYLAFTRKKLFADRIVEVFEGKGTYRDLVKKVFTKPYKLL